MTLFNPTSVVDTLLLSALCVIPYQFIFYLICTTFKTDKVTDFAGTSNFIILAIVSLIAGSASTARQALVTTYTIIWASRLAVFLLVRIIHWRFDHRFDSFRREGTLSVFWTFQSVWVIIVSLPVTLIGLSTSSTPFQTSDVVAAVLFAIGVILEAVADLQKLFHRPLDSPKPWIHSGVWRYSRHPNYFAEILVWISITIAAWPELPFIAKWLSLLSPVFIATLLLFVSGVPILEKSADRKYSGTDGYALHKRSTSVLIPFPPSWYAPLSPWLKRYVFLDFRYERRDSEEKPLLNVDEE